MAAANAFVMQFCSHRLQTGLCQSRREPGRLSFVCVSRVCTRMWKPEVNIDVFLDHSSPAPFQFSSSTLLKLFYSFIVVCAHVQCTCVGGRTATIVEVRGPLCGASSLLPSLHGFRGSDSLSLQRHLIDPPPNLRQRLSNTWSSLILTDSLASEL